MEGEVKGGWVYIMADRYRGTLYVGVTSDLAARVFAHREGRGSEFCKRYGLNRLVFGARPYDRALRPGARGRKSAGARGRVRFDP